MPVRLLAAVPALPVSDERAAVCFLEDVLGFEQLVHDGVGLGIVRRDGVELHVWVADGSAPGAERQLAGSGSCRLEVTGVAELRRLGVAHPHPHLHDKPWGTGEVAVLDPDGDLIGLYQRLTGQSQASAAASSVTSSPRSSDVSAS